MSFQIWYSNFLVKHPYITILTILISSIICSILPFTISTMEIPNFQDPLMGFSTRGTSIANALTSSRNLENESLKTSGLLTKNPKESLRIKGLLNNTLLDKPHLKHRGGRKKQKTRKYKLTNEIDNKPVYGKVVTSPQNVTSNPKSNRWELLRNNKGRELIEYEKRFCGSPDEKYAHVIVSHSDNQDLFTLENLLLMCELENLLMSLESVPGVCVSNTLRKCCKPWSLPNYIASIANRTSCLGITGKDVDQTKALLQICAPYFHDQKLYPECLLEKDCKVPIECLQHSVVLNILKYLTTINFLPRDDPTHVTHALQESIIFLPIAASSASVPLYHEIEKMGKEFKGLVIVAMDFGIKHIIFDEYLVQDLWLIGYGGVFIFLCVWKYTSSAFLTLMTIVAMGLTMTITNFFYRIVFQIKFFPFMNLLTVVICLGLGADNAFIFCKKWEMNKADESNDNNLSIIMLKTFRHAFKPMFVTSLTTAVAFLGSYVSSVTAISCFSIFSAITIVISFLLMISWFPACLVIHDQSRFLNHACTINFILRQIISRFQSHICCQFLSSLWNKKVEFVANAVIKLKYVWIVIFIAVGIAGTVIVFIHPKLNLPSSNDLQLFSSVHPFEKYDVYKDRFWFRREEDDMENFKMPLKFVWGVLPKDNGDHLNPSNFGDLELDPQFDMADPSSQKWLLDFCNNLQKQPFFEPRIGVSFTSCFIQTFVKSMNRSCIDEFYQKDITPCCNITEFPFNRATFDTCIIEEMAEIYAGSTDFTYPKTAGAMFSKDSSPTVKAVVVEFESNYRFSMSYEIIQKFDFTVNKWFKKEQETAPPSMGNGFFVSNFDFYDLQKELGTGTKISIFLSMALAAAVLSVFILNPLISALAVVTIYLTIITTIATLVLSGWTLNILEAIAISAAIGLAIDYSLHYCINYTMCPADMAGNREDATRFALSCTMGPTFMAGLTTAAAGFFMMFSSLLPYYKIGFFLLVLMTVSWLFATFFLGSLLATVGPIQNNCQYTYAGMLYRFCNTNEPVGPNEDPIAGTSSVQDLDRISFIRPGTPIPVKKKHFKEPKVRYRPNQELADKSPTSNISIIMEDDD